MVSAANEGNIFPFTVDEARLGQKDVRKSNLFYITDSARKNKTIQIVSTLPYKQPIALQDSQNNPKSFIHQ
jgi:hypothetical protein